MALNGDVLGDLIRANCETVIALHVYGQPFGPAERVALFRAIGNAIVSHITSSAVVNVGSVSGVTAGIDASGPGAGTIT
jgi:hypothetical protein